MKENALNYVSLEYNSFFFFLQTHSLFPSLSVHEEGEIESNNVNKKILVILNIAQISVMVSVIIIYKNYRSTSTGLCRALEYNMS